MLMKIIYQIQTIEYYQISEISKSVLSIESEEINDIPCLNILDNCLLKQCIILG